MDLLRLESLKAELKIDRLKIMCTGEIEVDWRELKELQLLDDGRSLKKTDDDKILRPSEVRYSEQPSDMERREWKFLLLRRSS